MYAVHNYSSCSLKRLFSKCSPKMTCSLQSLCTQPHKWVFNTDLHEHKGSPTCRWMLRWPHTLINNRVNKTPGLTAQCSIHDLTTELFTCNEQAMADMTHGTSHSATSCCLKTRALNILNGLVAKMQIKHFLSWKFLFWQHWNIWVRQTHLAASFWNPDGQAGLQTLTAPELRSLLTPVKSFWKTWVEVENVAYLWLEFLSKKQTCTKTPFKSHRCFN